MVSLEQHESRYSRSKNSLQSRLTANAIQPFKYVILGIFYVYHEFVFDNETFAAGVDYRRYFPGAEAMFSFCLVCPGQHV